MLKKFAKVTVESVKKQASEINFNLKNFSLQLNKKDGEIIDEIEYYLKERIEVLFSNEDIKIIKNYQDEFLNLIDFSIFFNNGQNFGIIFLENSDFIENKDRVLKMNIEIRIKILESMKNWNLLCISEKEWKSMNKEEKKDFFEEFVDFN